MPPDPLLNKAKAVHLASQNFRDYVLRSSGRGAGAPFGAQSPTLAQFHALGVLSALGPCSLKGFAGRLNISGPAASEMVERLVESGWVVRSQDPGDRRRVVLELTPRARRHTRDFEDHIIRQVTRLMKRMKPETVDAWVGVAVEMNQLLNEAREDGPAREEDTRHGR